MQTTKIYVNNREIQINIQANNNHHAIVFCHGASEGAGRYEQFCKLLINNFDTITYNHRGHENKQAVELESSKLLVADLKEVIKWSKKHYQKISVFAHSMGALICLLSLEVLSKDDAIILSGVPTINRQDKWALTLAKYPLRALRANKTSKILNDMFFQNKNKRIGLENNKWLTSRLEQVDKYNTSQLYGQHFTNHSLAILAQMTLKANSEKTFKQLATFNKVLLISGSTDVFANDGKNYYYITKYAQSAKVNIYENSYHEVHNDIDSGQLANDLIVFLQEGKNGEN